MDARGFDHPLRFFSTSRSRRGALSGLASGLQAMAILMRGGQESEAKKRKRKRKKKKNTCIPSCASKVCGDDGCGGTCGIDCANGQVCQEGRCGCPAGTETCGGQCVAICGADSARNPISCGCCLTNNLTLCFADGQCCSGNCDDVDLECVGRPSGDDCFFDAQCESGVCFGVVCD